MPTFIAASTYTVAQNAATKAFTIPAGAQEGDVAVVSYGATHAGRVIFLPHSWLRIHTVGVDAFTGAGYWKRLTAGDIAAGTVPFVTGLTTSSDACAVVCAVYRGARDLKRTVASAASTASGATTITSGSVTPENDGLLVVVGGHNAGTSSAGSFPGATLRGRVGGWPGAGLADKPASAGVAVNGQYAVTSAGDQGAVVAAVLLEPDTAESFPGFLEHVVGVAQVSVGAGTTMTVTHPADLQAGDLMLLSTSTFGASPAPGGWTELLAHTSGQVHSRVLWKRAAQGDVGATTSAQNDGSTNGAMSMTVLRNVDDPTIGASATNATTTGPVTATVDSFLVSIYASIGDTGDLAYPASSGAFSHAKALAGAAGISPWAKNYQVVAPMFAGDTLTPNVSQTVGGTNGRVMAAVLLSKQATPIPTLTVQGEAWVAPATWLDGMPLTPIRVAGEAWQIPAVWLDGAIPINHPIVVAGQAWAVPAVLLDGTPALRVPGAAWQTPAQWLDGTIPGLPIVVEGEAWQAVATWRDGSLLYVRTTELRNRAGGRNRVGSGENATELPLAARPATVTTEPIRVMAQQMPTPTLRKGRPS